MLVYVITYFIEIEINKYQKMVFCVKWFADVLTFKGVKASSKNHGAIIKRN